MSESEFLVITYYELCRLTGIPANRWSQWFLSRTSPRLDDLERAATALNLSLGVFVDLFATRRRLVTARNQNRAERSGAA